MRKSSVVHMAINTAKTILYYTPVIFLTRYLQSPTDSSHVQAGNVKCVSDHQMFRFRTVVRNLDQNLDGNLKTGHTSVLYSD